MKWKMKRAKKGKKGKNCHQNKSVPRKSENIKLTENRGNFCPFCPFPNFKLKIKNILIISIQ